MAKPPTRIEVKLRSNPADADGQVLTQVSCEVDFEGGAVWNQPCDWPPQYRTDFPPVPPEMEGVRFRKAGVDRALSTHFLFSEGQLKKVGKELYETLFSPEARGAIENSLNDDLDISFDLTNAKFLANEPLEAIFIERARIHPARNERTRITRYFRPGGVGQSGREVPYPANALFVAAAPAGNIDYEAEFAAIAKHEAELRKVADQHPAIDWQFLPNATIGELQDILAKNDLDILHFVGHGGYDEVLQENYLLFHHHINPDREQRVSADDFRGMLQNSSVSLVFLNACGSAQIVGADSFTGVAQGLIEDHTPFVLAMRDRISDESALAFSAAFYGQLAQRKTPAQAVSVARNRIYGIEGGGWRKVEFVTPVLYTTRERETLLPPAEETAAGGSVLSRAIDWIEAHPVVGGALLAALLVTPAGIFFSDVIGSDEQAVSSTGSGTEFEAEGDGSIDRNIGDRDAAPGQITADGNGGAIQGGGANGGSSGGAGGNSGDGSSSGGTSGGTAGVTPVPGVPDDPGRAAPAIEVVIVQNDSGAQIPTPTPPPTPTPTTSPPDGNMPPVAPPPPPVAAPPPPPAPLPCNRGPYMVFFNWDESTITPEAATVLDNARSAYANCGAASVMLAGHTDTSGTMAYNEGLAERRNESVRDYVTARGVSDMRISSQSFGETQLRVPTADGVRELQNRRVEITYGPATSAMQCNGDPLPGGNEAVEFNLASAHAPRENAERIARVLLDNPGCFVVLSGYADRAGPMVGSASLAQSRAQDIGAQLVEYGVEASRIVAFAYGEATPGADGDGASALGTVQVELVNYGKFTQARSKWNAEKAKSRQADPAADAM